MFAYMTDIETVDMKERREVEAEGNQQIINYEVKTLPNCGRGSDWIFQNWIVNSRYPTHSLGAGWLLNFLNWNLNPNSKI